jgi:hypothetical protein
VVVYLAVKDDADGSVLIPHWLMTTGNVDDGQAPMTEMHTKLFINPQAFSIRPAMGKLLRHLLEKNTVEGADESD